MHTTDPARSCHDQLTPHRLMVDGRQAAFFPKGGSSDSSRFKSRPMLTEVNEPVERADKSNAVLRAFHIEP